MTLFISLFTLFIPPHHISNQPFDEDEEGKEISFFHFDRSGKAMEVDEVEKSLS